MGDGEGRVDPPRAGWRRGFDMEACWGWYPGARGGGWEGGGGGGLGADEERPGTLLREMCYENE